MFRLRISSWFVQKLKDVEPIIKIEEVDGARLVLEFSDEIERMLGSKMKSVKVKIYITFMLYSNNFTYSKHVTEIASVIFSVSEAGGHS